MATAKWRNLQERQNHDLTLHGLCVADSVRMGLHSASHAPHRASHRSHRVRTETTHRPHRALIETAQRSVPHTPWNCQIPPQMCQFHGGS